jgi:hypothetical protein
MAHFAAAAERGNVAIVDVSAGNIHGVQRYNPFAWVAPLGLILIKAMPENPF